MQPANKATNGGFKPAQTPKNEHNTKGQIKIGGGVKEIAAQLAKNHITTTTTTTTRPQNPVVVKNIQPIAKGHEQDMHMARAYGIAEEIKFGAPQAMLKKFNLKHTELTPSGTQRPADVRNDAALAQVLQEQLNLEEPQRSQTEEEEEDFAIALSLQEQPQNNEKEILRNLTREMAQASGYRWNDELGMFINSESDLISEEEMVKRLGLA